MLKRESTQTRPIWNSNALFRNPCLMNRKMEMARQWMLANKLTINASKTKAIVISLKMNKSMLDYSIKCDESLISVQQNVK